jgi:hypothetical protein
MATKCIQPTPCDCWSEREQHCWASFVIYEACAQQRIAELEARDKLKAEEYDTRIVLAAQFERERDELRAKLADWQETYANIVAERCAPDEHHCTCVPALRAHIKELEAQLARAETRERDLELVNSRVEAFCAEYRSVFKNPVGKRGE